MKGPLNTCLKHRYTLIEQSDLNTLIEQSQYSSEEQCSKLIDKEIWLVMGSYCHCQQVVIFFFFFFFFFFGLQLTAWVKGPTLTLCPGPLNFFGRPWVQLQRNRHVESSAANKSACTEFRYKQITDQLETSRIVERSGSISYLVESSATKQPPCREFSCKKN